MSPTGPLETQRQASDLPAVQAVYEATRTGKPGAMTAANLAMLRAALDDAGVTPGAYEADILAWLAHWEPTAETALATAAFPPARVVVSGDLTFEERLDQLESQMREAGEQIGTLNARHEQGVRVRQVVTEEERAARMAEDQRIRERMADLAGGGLKLQAWGVACLLAGTIITAIW